MFTRILKMTSLLAQSIIVLTLFCATAVAQEISVQGLIKARQGDSMIIQTSSAPKLVVLLNDSTQVGQVQGVFKARRKDMSMAALIPGLAVKVKGGYNEQNQLVATEISFKGDDLKRAEAIQAGLHENKEQTEHQAVELARQQSELAAQKSQLTEQQQKIAANKASIAAATARFGQLDDYYIRDEVTVYFDNGKTNVASTYTPQLLALAEKAKAVDGYVIEVKGYASAVGNAELNQQLSEDRANAVTNILLQQGHIPLTRMLAPGAMGESHQIGNNGTEQGQAENRRVVVRVLQNKAVAGI
jgi:outer membrane protein OmpA-like peptidoglycan-associated protein